MNGSDDLEFHEESSRKEYVQALVSGNYLQGAAEGISKQVLDKGEGSLSENQREVYEAAVLGHKAGKTCKLCGPVSEWGDMAFVIDDKEDYCPRCRRNMDKD